MSDTITLKTTSLKKLFLGIFFFIICFVSYIFLPSNFLWVIFLFAGIYFCGILTFPYRIILDSNNLSYRSWFSSWQLFFKDIQRIEYYHMSSGRYNYSYYQIYDHANNCYKINAGFFSKKQIKFLLSFIIEHAPEALIGDSILNNKTTSFFQPFFVHDAKFVIAKEISKNKNISSYTLTDKDNNPYTTDTEKKIISIRMSSVAKWTAIIFICMGGYLLVYETYIFSMNHDIKQAEGIIFFIMFYSTIALLAFILYKWQNNKLHSK